MVGHGCHDAAGDVFLPFAADSDARLNCEHATDRKYTPFAGHALERLEAPVAEAQQ